MNDKPTLAKLEVRLLRSSEGGGINALAALLLAVLESLLPNLTFQKGPPYCNFIYKRTSTLVKINLIKKTQRIEFCLRKYKTIHFLKKL